jgi:DNA invertase Pin-like site-specific DNA recombinase
MLERQRDGIAKAKAAGKYKGRPVSIDAAQIRQLRAELGPAAIAKRLGIAQEFGLPCVGGIVARQPFA